MAGVGIPHSRITYGSDFPFTRAPGVEMLAGKMDAGITEMFSQKQRMTIVALTIWSAVLEAICDSIWITSILRLKFILACLAVAARQNVRD